MGKGFEDLWVVPSHPERDVAALAQPATERAGTVVVVKVRGVLAKRRGPYKGVTTNLAVRWHRPTGLSLSLLRVGHAKLMLLYTGQHVTRSPLDAPSLSAHIGIGCQGEGEGQAGATGSLQLALMDSAGSQTL